MSAAWSAALVLALLCASARAQDIEPLDIRWPQWICVHDGGGGAGLCFAGRDIVILDDCGTRRLSALGGDGWVTMRFHPNVHELPRRFFYRARIYYPVCYLNPPPPGDRQLAYYVVGDEVLQDNFEVCARYVQPGWDPL